VPIGEVDLRGIDDQQRSVIVVEKKLAVSRIDFFEIGLLYRLFVTDTALPYALQQHIGRRL